MPRVRCHRLGGVSSKMKARRGGLVIQEEKHNTANTPDFETITTTTPTGGDDKVA
jgi:hypothetical protein